MPRATSFYTAGVMTAATLIGVVALPAAWTTLAKQPVLAEKPAPVTAVNPNCNLTVGDPANAAVGPAFPDPTALANQALARYAREVRDYACTFTKQERINNKLRPAEEIEVRYREAPHSVYFVWKKNADGVKRALFIDAPEWLDDDGAKLARIEPAGSILRLVAPEIKLVINGSQAREASRRTIDEFGFRSSLSLLQRYNESAEKRGVLDFRYQGEGMVGGRPTHVLVRYLPYTGEDGAFPDAMMVIHLDKQWLLPTAVYSYADREGATLLGSYVMTDVTLNPGLTDADFQF